MAGAWWVRARRTYVGGVSGWNPGDRGPDVLSSGREEPSRWARPRVLWAVGLAAACLLVGGLADHRPDSSGSADSGPAFPAAARPVVDLRVGGIDEVIHCTHRCLRVPVFNAGRHAARVRTIGFDGWRMRARVIPVLVRPGSGENVRFALDIDCHAPRPTYSSTVQVHATVAGQLRLLSLRLPDGVGLVRRQYDRYCHVGPPATPQDLRGVTMRFLRGGPRPCAGAEDEVWLARRLLLDHRLPEKRAVR